MSDPINTSDANSTSNLVIGRINRACCVLGAFSVVSIGISSSLKYTVINPEVSIPMLGICAIAVLILSIIERKRTKKTNG